MTDNIVSAIQSLIPEVRCIYLFGSYADGSQTDTSDIDIAVLCPSKINPLKRWDMQEALARQFNRDVDLVDLLSASTVMQFQIIKHGLCLFSVENESTKFEMQVMSMYQHLNIERAAILDELMELNKHE